MYDVEIVRNGIEVNDLNAGSHIPDEGSLRGVKPQTWRGGENLRIPHTTHFKEIVHVFTGGGFIPREKDFLHSSLLVFNLARL